MIDMPFEKLLVWKKAVDLVDIVYDLTRNFPQEELFGLKSQMCRAAVSIPANIAEGSQRSSQKEFAHFIQIAKGSLAELRTETYISRRRSMISSDQWNGFVVPAQELDKMLRSFYKALVKKDNA
jgi:four helix bundle protein